MMTNEQFDSLVRGVEVYARANRRGYRARVAALALLGYGYVWLILLACLAALVFLVWAAFTTRTGTFALGKIGLVLLVFVYAIARALWVRFEAPVGVPLARRDAPAIFGLVDELCRALRTSSAGCADTDGGVTVYWGSRPIP